ncbi:YqaA family protein [Alteromonas oceanisediminis]|uniref:YqaA family protein n=1 Tax=Alteromonas oceanisediminis TaxID=2836180 RepID=UPI001BD935F8|nr:YqaA family protein [Alteromonas oceanisediminis]MBT0586952.1 DedA family protein [Alteromonas oceanisediminis]
MAAFLAATVLPLSSELVLSLTLLSGFSPLAVVAIATAGNVLGAMVNYWLGYRCGEPLAKRVLRMNDDDLERARARFARHGRIALCLAWVPIIGDPITVVAGVLKIRFSVFVVLVGLTKLLRYIVLSYLVLAV